MKKICLIIFGWCAAVAFGQSPTPPPKTSVQIINATSVPSIGLQVNGQNYYPEFPQGMYTADAPIENLKCIYRAKNLKTGAEATSSEFDFSPNTNQSLIILGDFSTDIPPDALRQPGQVGKETKKPYSPNVIFRVVSHALAANEEAIRIRVVNGMPGKLLKFATGNKEQTVNPGDDVVLQGQKPIADYAAVIDGVTVPVMMRQEGPLRNAIIIFYLEGDKPKFVRSFENTATSLRKQREAE